MVLLNVSPWKGVIHFRKLGKLGPRFFGPFRVVARLGTIAYQLDISEELRQTHKTFHVSQLWMCLLDNVSVVPLDDIKVDESLRYVERLVAILDRKMNAFHNKVVPLVKV